MAGDGQLPALLNGGETLGTIHVELLQHNERDQDEGDVADHRLVGEALAGAQPGGLLGVAEESATSAPRFLVRDRDSKLTRAFDDVAAADGTQTIKTPIQAPNANAFAGALGVDSPAGVSGLGADLESAPS